MASKKKGGDKKRTRAEIGRPLIMTPTRIAACTAALMNTDASVKDVAKRFQVTPATIYRTCGSKEDLLRIKIAELEGKKAKLNGRRKNAGRRREAEIEW